MSMNRRELLERAIAAIAEKRAEACNQIKVAERLNNPELMHFWRVEQEQYTHVYTGLIEWLWEVNHEQP